MESYKRLWNRLKVNVKDPEILKLMKEYEIDADINNPIRRIRRNVYPIKVTKQPWFPIYKRILEMIWAREKRGSIYENLVKNFRSEFLDWTKKVASGEKTADELSEWLEIKHKELQSKESGKKVGGKEFTKPLITASGFKRKTKSELSLEERTSIVIDELVYDFIPNVPKEFDDLDIKRYEEDWRQELWTYCWEHREKNLNLKQLITNYNKLSRKQYMFARNNMFSVMNRYIISYIAKMQYSCNDIAKYNMTDKYKEEIFYNADDLEEIEYMDIDSTEKPKYFITNETEDLEIQEIMETIENYFKDNSAYTDFMLWRYKKVLELRYGFGPEGRVYTLQEIGDYLHISKERARQMEAWILQMIRKKLNTEEGGDDLF